MGTDFAPGALTGWEHLSGFVQYSDPFGMFNEAADAWHIPDDAPSQIAVRMTAQARIDNNGTASEGAGIGFGIAGNNPFQNPNAAVYIAQEIARRQDFAAVALQLTTPFFLGEPGSLYTYWLYQETANTLEVLAGETPGLTPPPWHTWWGIEVWS
jgi:hypothetical protein